MDIKALVHLATAASAIVPEIRFIVFGSSSAFGSFPDLAEHIASYKQTLDADIVPDPVDQGTYDLLTECLGKESAFFDRYGYYADINGPRAFECFPADFRERLVPLQECPNVFALEPNDMAVAKLIAGREKDIRLLSILLARGCLEEAAIRTRLWHLEMDDKLIVRTDLALRATVAAARVLGYTVQCPERPWEPR
ncbi:MAG: hypothetical protein JWO94_2661 [Verrucomicrobiaceae bacterium]|nr:hypothetical protein [Verrucomicrobiaceae bacterium]